MNTMPASRPCPQCGSPIPAGTAEGLCPRCLLVLNLATQSRMAGDTQPPASGPAAPPPTLEEVAKLFPQLEIIRLVGTGGMGAVYQARQPALDRHVALKLLHTPPANDPGFAERFAQEARALAKLSHPNIVALHESGQAGGRPYFLMEFVDGVNLRQLQQAGRLSPREALQIVPQVCDALQYAHDEGIVHRDIKPENVLIDRKGRVKVADFGLAKLMGRETASTRLTAAGNVMGTPHYMAPEQVEHPLEVDHRADIFSLGVVFYELLTGELPLGKFPMPSKKVRIDVRLDEVVLKALEKEPALRYGQASELKTRVETITGTPAMAGPSVVETGKTKRMRGQILGGSLGLALMAVGMAINITPFQPYGSGILIWEIPLTCAAIGVALTANSLVMLRVARDVMLVNGIGLLSAVIPLALDCPWMLRTHSHVLIIAACGIGIVAGVLKLFNAGPFKTRVETITKGVSGAKWAFGREAPPNMRGLAYVALGWLIAGLIGVPTMVALSDETAALCFGAVFGLMALVCGIEARSERLGRRVAWATAAILVAFGLTMGVWTVVRRSQMAESMAKIQRQADPWPPSPRLTVDAVLRDYEIPRFHVEWPASSWRLKHFAGFEVKEHFFLRINGTDYPLRTAHAPYVARAFDLDPNEEGVPVVWTPGKYRAAYVVKDFDYISPLFPQGGFHRGENASKEVTFEISSQPGEAKSGAPVFGPVIERVVKGALDVDTGREAQLPESVTKLDDIAEAVLEAAAWFEHEGMDVFTDTGMQFSGFGMWTVAQDQSQWTSLTAPQVMAILAASTIKPQAYVRLNGGATYAIQTREGGKGVLQILGFSDDGMKIRYKMVRNGSDAKQGAESAAQEWLSLMDKGDYAQSWDAAAESFRGAVTKQKWAAGSEKIRKPLGDVVSRTLTLTQQTKTFPGMSDGSYWMAEYDTAFAGQKSAAEVVTFALEKDGRWRVIGYLIRPRTEEQRAVVVAARTWLSGIDDGRYAESWSNAAGLFRDALSQKKWVEALEEVRRPLGARVFRMADACTTTTSLPGVPAGKYVVMQFNAAFSENKTVDVETVTFVQEKDGVWRAAGYFIK